MKTVIRLLTVAAVALAIAPMPTVYAGDTTHLTTKKKVVVHKKYHHIVRRQGPLYPDLEPYRSLGFIGPYPGSCAYDRAAGRCMIDLGYGRCEPCEVGSGGRF